MASEASAGRVGPAARGGRSRRVRRAAAAAGLASALTLTACGDGDGGSDDSAATPTPSATRTADSGGGTGGSGATGAPAGDLQGSWLTTADGKAVVLMVNGGEAALFATGGTMCSGTAEDDDGGTISLTCPAGNGDRTKGTVESVDATSLTVAWEGPAGTETYTKAEGGSLPPGLPTEGVEP